jgi:hypothetical protein
MDRTTSKNLSAPLAEPVELTDAELDMVAAGAPLDTGAGVRTASFATIENGTYPNGLLGTSNPGFGTTTATGTSGGQNQVGEGQGVFTTGNSGQSNPGFGNFLR